jgi:macrodomain Ter protein organizer (MatP/YcbG family)
VRNKNTKTQEIQEIIPRLLKDLNLETKIKNKVHEILDKNGYFRETSQITATKFKNCKNMSKLPSYFFDQDHEPLENVSQIKKQWNETLKNKLLNGVRSTRKPWVRPKKPKTMTKKQVV